MTECH
jgi:hypothetical protein